ncbi:reticulon-like protein B17 [Zingiber officinale]|uniref:reticulon-like protein B17 n=1 Tax=Zingiber officinale TaxID=94328 RepID=UPI001C4DD415|nr:reticulon-like protein B17 [Zingiber officinale]
MDSPPPAAPSPPCTRSSAEPRHRSKSASRIVIATASDENQIIPFLATPPSRKHNSPLLSPSPLQDIVLLSPSPHLKPKRRSAAAAAIEDGSPQAGGTPCGRRKSRAAAAMVLMGCASSPRKGRRARRRLEKDVVREERDLGHLADGDGVGNGRVRITRRSRERSSLVTSVPPPSPITVSQQEPREAPINNEDCRSSLDGIQEHIFELVMWKNVAKSSLWFGLGTLFFLSSCFSKDFSFSMISAMSHLGLAILGLAFFKDSIPQRQQLNVRSKVQITDEDILRAAQVILPLANVAFAKIQEIFCGDPLRTLQVAPVLLSGAMYGHLITLRRLIATCFFVSFTLPKFYSCYSHQIHNKVENSINRIQETWKSCPRKKLIAISTATIFWNLFSVKSRLFAVFFSVVILRYHHRQVEDCAKEEREESSR